MLPKCTIIISKGGNTHKIIGEEKSEICYELSDLGKAAGKVVEDKEKDHTDVYQHVERK